MEKVENITALIMKISILTIGLIDFSHGGVGSV